MRGLLSLDLQGRRLGPAAAPRRSAHPRSAWSLDALGHGARARASLSCLEVAHVHHAGGQRSVDGAHIHTWTWT